jgi:hypothetical protein
MTNSVIDQSQRKAAKIAGITLLFSIIIMVLPFYTITLRLIVHGNPVETANNIIVHENLFRINIACYLISVFNIIILFTALDIILKALSRIIARIALFCRMLYAFTWSITVLNMLVVVRILKDDSFLKVFKAEQLQNITWHLLGTEAYYIGLPFWSLASLLCCYLFFTSKYISRIVAGLGLIASAWAVICSMAYLIFPNFKELINPDLYDLPLVFFELTLGLWLLLKGLNPLKLSGTSISSSHEQEKVLQFADNQININERTNK